MAIDVRNIVVGAANVFFSASAGTQRSGDPTGSFGSGSTASSGVQVLRTSTYAASWVEAGLTTEGVDISYEPNYGEVMVDQLLDVAKIFKQSLRVTAKTSLAEATLANLEFAFGNANTVTYSPSSVTMNLAAGSLGAEPVERSLVFISQSAPTGVNPTTASSIVTPSGVGDERVYFARRVVAMDTVAHSLKRDAATVFPVTFRLLPDTAFNGAEYGKIVDRVYNVSYSF
ncbi:MAG: hypothetical protein EBU08_05460 [Micrococcales bacterium]|nr:hypothetical protein [Micrococcales bacterium]